MAIQHIKYQGLHDCHFSFMPQGSQVAPFTMLSLNVSEEGIYICLKIEDMCFIYDLLAQDHVICQHFTRALII
jgi:hypothetical protein